MSNLVDFTEDQLEGELARRRKAQSEGLCDFCGKNMSQDVCSFPSRHETNRRYEIFPKGLSFLPLYMLYPYRGPNPLDARSQVGDWLREHSGEVITLDNDPFGLSARTPENDRKRFEALADGWRKRFDELMALVLEARRLNRNLDRAVIEVPCGAFDIFYEKCLSERVA